MPTPSIVATQECFINSAQGTPFPSFGVVWYTGCPDCKILGQCLSSSLPWARALVLGQVQARSLGKRWFPKLGWGYSQILDQTTVEGLSYFGHDQHQTLAEMEFPVPGFLFVASLAQVMIVGLHLWSNACAFFVASSPPLSQSFPHRF